MNPRQAIASFLHLFAVLAFFSAAIAIFALPYLPEAKVKAAEWILNRPEYCEKLAIGLFLAALLLLMGFYGINRGKRLRIVMGRHLASVDAMAIRQTLDECFKAKFSEKIRLLDVEVLSAAGLEIEVSMAAMEEGEREALYAKAETELTVLLKERFGYAKPFHLLVKI